MVLESEECRDNVRTGARGKIGRGPREECFEARGVVDAPLASDARPHEAAACFTCVRSSIRDRPVRSQLNYLFAWTVPLRTVRWAGDRLGTSSCVVSQLGCISWCDQSRVVI